MTEKTEKKKHLILDGICPEDPTEMIVEVHSYSNPSVLWINQSAQVVAVDVAYYQISAIREN